MPTVLVVESDAILRNLLRDILSRNGYVVLDAVHLKEAGVLLKAMPTQTVDLMIVEGNAFDAAAIREEILSMRPEIKILITDRASAGSGRSEVAGTFGAPVLREPFTEQQLRGHIEALLKPRIQ